MLTVLSARGLTLKGHNKLDAYVSLSLSGEGSWKSKVQTDIRKTTGDCSWDQRCELYVFQFLFFFICFLSSINLIQVS